MKQGHLFGGCRAHLFIHLLCWLLLLVLPVGTQAADPSTAAPLADQSSMPPPTIALLPSHLDGYDLGPFLSHWYDAAEHSSLDAARNALRAGRFAPMERQSPNLGFARGHHWFHVVMQNALGFRRMILLEVDYPILDQIEFFCFGPGQEPTYFPAGDHVQFSSRVVKVRNYVVPLNLEPYRSTECLIRARSTSNVIFPLRVFDNVPYMKYRYTASRVEM